MDLDKYEVETSESVTVFSFVSEGINGRITKLVKYSETNLKGYYNLAFGDVDKKTGEINDTIVSDNGDSEKVLATVASTVYAFTAKHRNSFVYAKGSTHGRNRLYRIGITKYLDKIYEDFMVYGLVDDEWLPFEKGTEYDAYLVKRRND